LLPQPAVSQEYDYAEEVVDEPMMPASKSDMQREQIVRALRRNGGSRRAAAAELFMSERTLYRRIKELGIEE
jgi:DNA-binding NtrC family response regulator